MEPFRSGCVRPRRSRCANDYFRIADAHLDAGGGTADIGEFAWNDGRITTRGAFSGIAVANAAKLAGVALPLETTLVAGGECVDRRRTATERPFSIRRESGDVFADVDDRRHVAAARTRHHCA